MCNGYASHSHPASAGCYAAEHERNRFNGFFPRIHTDLLVSRAVFGFCREQQSYARRVWVVRDNFDHHLT